MKSRKLHYIIHDPNSRDAMANYLVGLFVEVNAPKIEAALQSAANKINDEDKENDEESHSEKAG